MHSCQEGCLLTKTGGLCFIYFLIFIFLIFQFLIGLLTSKNGWNISSGVLSTI